MKVFSDQWSAVGQASGLWSVVGFCFALSAMLVALCTSAHAQQQKKISRVGFLGNSTAELEANLVGPFREGRRELGYVEGQNLVIEYRWAGGDYARFPALIAELIASNVDVIVTAGTPATQAYQKAKTSIPLVMIAVGDPVGTGHRRVPQPTRRKHHRVDLDLTGTGR